MSTVELTRDEILAEIAQHEVRLDELRAMLPSAIKTFFRFRCKPDRTVMIYATDREQADERLRSRMNQRYGDDWAVISKVVDAYKDPAIAANQSRGSLLMCLTDVEAREFVSDFRANDFGKIQQTNNLPKSQVTRDVEHWEQLQRHANV